MRADECVRVRHHDPYAHGEYWWHVASNVMWFGDNLDNLKQSSYTVHELRQRGWSEAFPSQLRLPVGV